MTFLAVVAGVAALIHVYLYQRLVRGTTTSRRLRRFGAAVTVLLALLVVAAPVAGRTLERSTARLLTWPGYVWLALMFYLLVCLLALELPRLLVWLSMRRPPARVEITATAGASGTRSTEQLGSGHPGEGQRHQPSPSGPDERLMSRRLVLARGTAAIAGAAAAGLVGYGMTSALGPPRIANITVPLRRLGAELDGLRIALVSDLHLGPTLGRWHAERVVTMINELEPDLVALVGDLVDGTVDELGEDAAPLADLASRHGSFFVTGNHEYYSGVAQWVPELERLGVQPLRNERVEISAGAAVLDLAGVDDLAGTDDGEGPDHERALGGRDSSRPVVLLAHQPVQVREAAARGVDLQLSGHTHGGQLYPFHYLIRLQQPVVAGLHRFGDTQLYVTSGVGFWGPPVRVGAPPEITLVELTRA